MVCDCSAYQRHAKICTANVCLHLLSFNTHREGGRSRERGKRSAVLTAERGAATPLYSRLGRPTCVLISLSFQHVAAHETTTIKRLSPPRVIAADREPPPQRRPPSATPAPDGFVRGKEGGCCWHRLETFPAPHATGPTTLPTWKWLTREWSCRTQ